MNGQIEWIEYCKSGNKPDDIPQKPESTFKKDFKGYGDWLGTGYVANQKRQYRPFKEAREFTRAKEKGYQKIQSAIIKKINLDEVIPAGHLRPELPRNFPLEPRRTSGPFAAAQHLP